MASRVPAKSILKQPADITRPTISDEEKAKAERDRRNLGLALYHANKIQSQKDVQALILSNTEKLLDSPISSVPQLAHAPSFVALIEIFQPSDFDSLVEERRIDGKCGYALCANSPRSTTLGPAAAWKLKGKGAGNFCSHECLQKALYVKAQLSEVPAWERQPGQQSEVMLPESDRKTVEQSQPASVHGFKQRSSNDNELAAERGDQAGSFRPNQVMLDTIVEKRTARSQPLAPAKTMDSPHNSIEGYVPPSKPDGDRFAPQALSQTKHDRVEKAPAATDRHHQKNEEEEAWSGLYENLAIR